MTDMPRSRCATARSAAVRRLASSGDQHRIHRCESSCRRGRGLAIVDSLSEEVTVEHHGDDVVVTARVRVDYKESGPSW